jgi:hypothetical protein
MTTPRESERLLAEALRARAAGSPIGHGTSSGSRPVAVRQPLTLLQLVLASLIAGLVIGILVAVFTLL